MPSEKPSITLTTMRAILVVSLLMIGTRAIAQEKILHNFNNTNGKDGYSPEAGLVFDSSGNLYGTTNVGGLHQGGAAFELSPVKTGGWFERVLFSFATKKPGDFPRANLVLDGAGNLYGTTYQGGTFGGGVAFQLKHVPGSGWKETILYDLGRDEAASRPMASMVFDAAGNLYGTAGSEGPYNAGVVFELSPDGDGTWTASVLHSFAGGPADGRAPFANVILDSAGNLYGTTRNGGAHTYGTVFELSPVGDGTWTQLLLHSFQKNNGDGYNPWGGVIFDKARNLYGTTIAGGAYGGGTVFKLSPASGGGWSERILHSFGNGTDGNEPAVGLVADASGNLYGVTSRGGAYSTSTMPGRTVFKLSPVGNGSWTEAILHSFGKGTDGSVPSGALILDGGSNLYGTTSGGGLYGGGMVFEITP
jgi:uncharacterized repeat protein (TIGR03803 family)